MTPTSSKWPRWAQRDFCSSKPPRTFWPRRFAKSKKETPFSAPPLPSASSDRDRRSRSIEEGSLKKKGNRLSSREVEVLQLIAEGKPNKQVAAELGVSFKTVDKHRQHLMAKLNIHDIAGLTRYAIARGNHREQCPGDHRLAQTRGIAVFSVAPGLARGQPVPMSAVPEKPQMGEIPYG